MLKIEWQEHWCPSPRMWNESQFSTVHLKIEAIYWISRYKLQFDTCHSRLKDDAGSVFMSLERQSKIVLNVQVLFGGRGGVTFSRNSLVSCQLHVTVTCFPIPPSARPKHQVTVSNGSILFFQNSSKRFIVLFPAGYDSHGRPSKGVNSSISVFHNSWKIFTILFPEGGI